MVTFQLTEHAVYLLYGLQLFLFLLCENHFLSTLCCRFFCNITLYICITRFAQHLCDDIPQCCEYVQVAILLGGIYVHTGIGYAFFVCSRVGDFSFVSSPSMRDNIFISVKLSSAAMRSV